jgi:hypothetical protein
MGTEGSLKLGLRLEIEMARRDKRLMPCVRRRD